MKSLKRESVKASASAGDHCPVRYWGGCDGYISRRDAEEKRAANANRGFSSLLREVQNGEEITILSRGTPVARIISVNSGALPKNEMKKILLSRLKAQGVTGLLKWYSVSRILLSFWRH